MWEKLGYFDANFWPNGYFSDNDYARRANLIGVRACGLAHAAYSSCRGGKHSET